MRYNPATKYLFFISQKDNYRKISNETQYPFISLKSPFTLKAMLVGLVLVAGYI